MTVSTHFNCASAHCFVT